MERLRRENQEELHTAKRHNEGSIEVGGQVCDSPFSSLKLAVHQQGFQEAQVEDRKCTQT